MLRAGDVIENPVTGERITFVRTSAQTGGALAELDLELRPDAVLAAEHIHRHQEEKFEILDGHVLLRCRGKLKQGFPIDRLTVGDSGARLLHDVVFGGPREDEVRHAAPPRRGARRGASSPA